MDKDEDRKKTVLETYLRLALFADTPKEQSNRNTTTTKSINGAVESNAKINFDIRKQMEEDWKQWEEWRKQPPMPAVCTITPKFNNDYIASDTETKYWQQIFDGEDVLDASEIIRRMLIEELLEITPGNQTKMLNLIFRSVHNRVLESVSGDFSHKYKIREVK